jgi:excisionase family DNA binding protein
MDRLMTVAEVMDQLGLAERTVRQMVADGRLPAIRLDGVRAIRVPEPAVRALMRPSGHIEGIRA